MKHQRSLLISLAILALVFLACNGAEEATKQPEASATAIPLVSSPTSPAPTPIQEFRGVRIGMPADDVLELWGKGSATRQVGTDSFGLVMEWHYPYATLVIKMREVGGVTCYRVVEIHPS